MQLPQVLTLSNRFLLSLHSVCSLQFKAWLVWECVLKALFSTGIKNIEVRKTVIIRSVLLCHFPNSQVCKHPHKSESCQHLDKLFWQHWKWRRKRRQNVQNVWIPVSLNGSFKEILGHRSGYFLASCFQWVCSLPTFGEQNTKGR